MEACFTPHWNVETGSCRGMKTGQVGGVAAAKLVIPVGEKVLSKSPHHMVSPFYKPDQKVPCYLDKTCANDQLKAQGHNHGPDYPSRSQ